MVGARASARVTLDAQRVVVSYSQFAEARVGYQKASRDR
jgi:hypothetical protein